MQMQITTAEIQNIMQEFYHENQRLPNTLLIPAAHEIDGMTPNRINIIFGMKVVYAAVPIPRAAIL